jgi:membrane associated rhomboid family serine protease
MKIRYNAPVTLTFALISAIILALDQFLGTQIIPTICTAPPKGFFEIRNPLSYIRLVAHVAGHADWSHLLSNFSFILLIGPILEEKYGSVTLLIMILFTALVTGIINSLFFSTGLLGASGIVFMMILLSSFTNINGKDIPLTFILILILYLSREIINSFKTDDISEFAHIIGGFCGSLFGYLKPARRNA